MQRLIGKKVGNAQLGDGIITKAEDTDKGIFITVEFPNNITKRYGFPQAIGKTLKDDPELQTIAQDIAKEKDEARKKAEKEAIRKKIKLAEEKIKVTNRQQVFNSKTLRIFKVHQGISFKEESHNGYVWAPASGNFHHEILKSIQPGDIIFHYSGGNLVAVGEALNEYFDCPCPPGLTGNGWGNIGYRVEVRYELLAAPYSLDVHRSYIIDNKADQYSSFDKNGNACQGYMYELEYPLAVLFKKGLLAVGQPAGVQRVLNRL